MRRLVLFMHCSLDGFAGGPDGKLDWILINENMFDLAKERTDLSDTALYGRVTFQMMESYWPDAGKKPDASKHDIDHSAWYNKVKKVVVSKTLKATDFSNTTIISDNIIGEIQRLKQHDGKDIIIFGSPSLSHSLMAENLIDDYWLLINPILLGCGIPLFKGIKELTKLKLAESKVFSSGVVCTHYQK